MCAWPTLRTVGSQGLWLPTVDATTGEMTGMMGLPDLFECELWGPISKTATASKTSGSWKPLTAPVVAIVPEVLT